MQWTVGFKLIRKVSTLPVKTLLSEYFISSALVDWPLAFYERNLSSWNYINDLFFFIGYYGVIFYERKAAAFATFSISRSVGNTISFAYGNSLCVMTKVIILLLLNFIGICLFCHVYYDNERLKKKKMLQSLQPS